MSQVKFFSIQKYIASVVIVKRVFWLSLNGLIVVFLSHVELAKMVIGKSFVVIVK